MLARLFILGCLLAVAHAEVGVNCTADTDCDSFSEFCKFPEEQEEEVPRTGAGGGGYGGGGGFSAGGGYQERPYPFVGRDVPRGGVEDEEVEEHEEPTEPQGECHLKYQLYDNCEQDNECDTGHCLFGPVPGVDEFDEGYGKCTQCAKDSDCEGQTFCDHPVVNHQCFSSFYEHLREEEEHEEDEDDEEHGGTHPGGPPPPPRFGSHGSGIAFSSSPVSGGAHPPPHRGAQFTSPLRSGSATGGGGVAGTVGEDPSVKDLLTLFQLIAVHRPGQSGEGGEHTEDMRGGPRVRPGRFPTYDSRGRREKRELNHYSLNTPTFTCKEKKPTHSPCKRSPECQSDKCTVEGQCVA